MDAALIKTILEARLSFILIFLVLPIEKLRKKYLINICPTKNGTSSTEIVSKCEIIISIIKKENKCIVDFLGNFN